MVDQARDPGDRLTFRERICYAIGNFGANIPFGLANAYLLYFYTDVWGVPAAIVASVFLFSRIADAIFDPFLGLLIDRTHTRFGKHRPFVLAGCIPLAICGAAVFHAPELEGTAKIMYIYVTCT